MPTYLVVGAAPWVVAGGLVAAAWDQGGALHNQGVEDGLE